MLKKEVEGMAVVVMAQMAEFVEKDIIAQEDRQTDYVQIQVDVSTGRATSPVGGIVLDRHLIIYESVARGKFGQTGREFGLGLTTQGLDFGGSDCRDILDAFLLAPQSLEDPFAFHSEERHGSGVRDKIRDRHTDTPDGMHTDGNATRPGTLPEHHLPYFRVSNDFLRDHPSVIDPFEEIEEQTGEFRGVADI